MCSAVQPWGHFSEPNLAETHISAFITPSGHKKTLFSRLPQGWAGPSGEPPTLFLCVATLEATRVETVASSAHEAWSPSCLLETAVK